MKKKITFGLVAFAMVAASAVFMKSIAKDDLSAMIQANWQSLSGMDNHGTKTPIIGLVNVGYLR